MENYKTSGLGKKWFWTALYFLCVNSAVQAQFLAESFIIGNLGKNVSVQDILQNGDTSYIYGTYTGEMTIEGIPLSHEGEADAFLIKKVNGEIEWIFHGGSAGKESTANLAFNEANNIILSGAFWNQAIFDGTILQSQGSSKAIYILEVSPEGTLLDYQIVNGTGQKDIIGLEIIEDYIYIAGSFGDTLFVAGAQAIAKSEKDIFVLKLERQSQEAWIQNYGTEGKNDAIDFSWQPEEQQFIISGHFNEKISVADDSIQTNTFDEDLFLAAFNINGEGKWIQKMGGQFDDFNAAHCSDEEGNIFLTGVYRGIINFEDGSQINTGGIANSDSYLIKCDAEGNKIWARTLGESGSEFGTDLCVNNNKIYWLGYYDKAFTLDKINFSESEGSLNGCFAVFSTEGTMETNFILKSNNIITPQGMTNTATGALLYGEFTGTANLSEPFDAGANFYGFVSKLNLESVSTSGLHLKEAIVFPNPTAGNIIIKLGTHTEHIELYDLQGKVVYKSSHRLMEHQLNLFKIKDGIYFWKSERGYSGRIIKKRVSN